MKRRCSLDFETFLIGPGAVFPKPVCYTLAARPAPGADVITLIRGNGDPDFWSALEGLIDQALSGDVEIVTHNGGGFDLPVAALWSPGQRLMPKVWRLLDQGGVRDVMIREMLLNLCLHGYVSDYFLPDGSKKDVYYGLSELVFTYLGRDRSHEKGTKDKRTGKVDEREDIWRLHFDTLDGLRADQYPEEARRYALDDTVDQLLVCEAQDRKAHQELTVNDARFPTGIIGVEAGTPFDVFRTEPLHVGAAFALALMTFVGFGVDKAEVAKMKAAVEHALRPEQVNLLYESGILVRAQGPVPYANNATNPDGSPKLTKGKKQRKSNTRLLEIVIDVHAQNAACDEETCPRFRQDCTDHGLPPLKRNDPSPTEIRNAAASGRDPEGSISCDADVIDSLASFSPVLGQYAHWQGLGKLLTMEIPLLEGTDVIHATFEVFKKTGRTSSRGSKFFPSRNIQQLPRGFDVEELGPDGRAVCVNGKPVTIRIEPRRCYVPRTKGWVLLSVDYAALELCTLAQAVYTALGYSRMRDVINAGLDLHAWFGAQLAHGTALHFAERCLKVGATDYDSRYRVFHALRGGGDDEKAFYKKFRAWAKPNNLAWGGGLGVRKFVDYARQVFGILMTIEEAKQNKALWFDAFPEVREFLNRYVRVNLKDEVHQGDDGKERFAYFSPFGAYRSNCRFTEAANGAGLQTRAGEGAKLATWAVTRACWDPGQKNEILYGCRPLAFVHDELLVELPDDPWIHERAFEVSRLMIEQMRIVCPDVLIKAEPAVSRAWEKGVESVYDENERLCVWEPGRKYRLDEKGRFRR